jgi:peptide/nickel transport system substrate-binding protein
MKKIGILSLLVIILLPSCQKAEKIKYEGKRGGTLIVSVTNEPTTLNPIYPSLSGLSPVTEKLFTPLHEYRADGKITTGLAQSWVYSEDMRSITYTIRKDAKWHDGTPVTAEDIVFTVKQIKDPANKSPLSQQIRYVKDVKAIGVREVRFTFDKVYADELLNSNIRPIPKHKIEKETGNLQISDFSFNPVGDGPYKLKEWRQGDWVELVANPDYFRGRPPLDRIVFYFPSSVEELMDEIKLGVIDIAYDLPPAKYDTIKGYRTIVSPGEAYTYMGWNLNRFKDKKLREALSMAIDRRGIITKLLKGHAENLNGPITPEHWAYNPKIKGIKYDKEKAKELIEQLGYSKRRRGKFYSNLKVLILVEEGNPIRSKVADSIALDLRSIGVNATVEELRGSRLISRLLNHDFDAYILGWNVEKAFNPLSIWGSRGDYNFVGYKNKRVDKLIREALLSLDREKAKKAWYEFQEIIADDLPYTFLYAPKTITLVKKDINGIKEGDKRPIISFLDELSFKKIPTTTVELASIGKHYEEMKRGTPEETTETPLPPQTQASTEEILQAAATTTIEEGEKIGADTSELTTEATAEEEKVVKKKGPVIPPTLTYYPTKRDYPESARKLEVRGQVFIKLHITKTGVVDKAEIIKGLFPACDAAALLDARKCKFDPATQGGEPVEYDELTLPFRFPPEGW